MNLTPSPLEMIRDGKKTIEAWGASFSVCFILYVFDTFDELYKKLPLLDCGYTEDDIKTASPDDMEKYYSKEKQKQHGVVGIKISLK